jgi:hypothetical protein
MVGRVDCCTVTTANEPTDPRLWFIRPGENAHLWESFRDERVIGVGYSLDKSPEDITTLDRAGLDRVLREVKPTARSATASQVWKFVHELGIGDMVLVPRDRGRTVALGRVTGPCRREGVIRAYVRDVEWLETDVSVLDWDDDLRRSLRVRRTLWQPGAPQALERITALVGLAPEPFGGTGTDGVDPSSGASPRGHRTDHDARLKLGEYRRARETPLPGARLPFESDPDEIDKASAAHGRIQNALADWLSEQRLEPLSSSGGPVEVEADPSQRRNTDGVSRSVAIRSAGLSQSRTRRGRPFSPACTLATSSAVWTDRSVPLGK